MARIVKLKLTGLAEQFIIEMEKQGLNEADLIAQGLGLLEEVWRTRRVAVVKDSFRQRSISSKDTEENNILERFLYVQTPQTMNSERARNNESTDFY